MTKIFRLMYNETLMNIVFPGSAIDLFLLSHDHFCVPTLEQLGSAAIWETRFLFHGHVL